MIEKSQYLEEVKAFRDSINFDAPVSVLQQSAFDTHCSTKQSVIVNGRDISLCLKTWTSEVEDIAVRNLRAKKAKYIFFVNEKSKEERNFGKYCVAAVHSPHHGITLFTGCIIVAIADPSRPVYVCVRLYSIYGSCNDLDVILYDIEGMRLNMRRINEGVRDGISILKKGNYSVNLDLKGTNIIQYIDTAESLYLKHMEENKMFPHLHTYLRIKSTCVDPFQAKETINPRDILPDEVQHDPTYTLYDAEREDTEVIKLAKSQIMLKGINPFSVKEKIPERAGEKTCDGDINKDFDNDGTCGSKKDGTCGTKKVKSTRISQRSSVKKGTEPCDDNVDIDSYTDGSCGSKKVASKRSSKIQEPVSKCDRPDKNTAKTQSNPSISYSEEQLDKIVAESTKRVEARYEGALSQMESQIEQQNRQIQQLMKQQLTKAGGAERDEKATKKSKKRKNEKEEKLKTKVKSPKKKGLSESEGSDDDDISDDESNSSDDDYDSDNSSNDDEKEDFMHYAKLFKNMLSTCSKVKRKRKAKHDSRRRWKKVRNRVNGKEAPSQVIINKFES